MIFEQSPDAMKNLVLFMVCLSIAGSIVAGIHYAVIDLPAQDGALHPPANGESCSFILTGNCANIRSTICMTAGANMEFTRSCMETMGCCV